MSASDLQSTKRLRESDVIRAYVTFMLGFLGRGLVAASEVDDVSRREIEGFPEELLFEMSVMPHGPSVRVRKRNGELVLAPLDDEPPTLAIRFKHLRHALAALVFREGTTTLFTDDRMVVEGDIASAVRMKRLLDRLLVLTLPQLIASKVLLRVPVVPGKGRATTRLLARMARNAVTHEEAS